MIALIRMLHFLGFIRITHKSVTRWAATGNVSKLRLAALYGNYKIRLFAVNKLGALKALTALSTLILATKDEVRLVAEAAINALKKYNLTTEIELALKNAATFWAAKDKAALGRKNYNNALKNSVGSEAVKLNKSKMKKLQSAKEFLRVSHWGKGGKLSI